MSKIKEKSRLKGVKRIPSKLSCIDISLTSVNELEELSAPPPSHASFTSMKNHIFDRDPATLELAKAAEAKQRRKRDETLLALEKIQGRIDYTISEFEGSKGGQGDRNGEQNTDVNFAMIQDSNQLYELLADPKVRSRYRQKLTVFIVGYEEKHDELESVLGQLHDFFEETQAGGTGDLLKEVAGEELDLDKATKELGAALSTAQNAVKKLVGIKKEMDQLMSIVAAYPDTSKGRKKMEKALMKAQEEVATFSNSLDEVQTSLKQSTEKCSQLQVQLDAKNQECTKLRTTADQVKLLQVGIEKLKRELDEAKTALKMSQEELSVAKSKPQPVVAMTQEVDSKYVAELKAELELEKSKIQQLVADMDALVENHKSEMEAMKREHETESNEVRGRFEDQLRSLMEEDMFGDGDLEHRDSEGDDDYKDPTLSSPTEKTPAEGDLEEEVDQGEVKDEDSSPTGSKTSIPRHDDTGNEIESELRKEFEEKEKLAQIQNEEIKAKSRKMIALLQSQLTDVNSKKAAEKKEFEVEVSDLKEELERSRHVNTELEKELASLQEERNSLLERLQKMEEELQQTKEELAMWLSRDVDQHSIAKSAALGSLSSLHQIQSPLQSVSTVPMAAQEEEPFGHVESQIFMSGDDLQSNGLSEQSVISMDPAPLGSPLQSGLLSDGGSFLGANFKQIAPQSTPPQCSLPMLAMSRLSHHSSVAQGGTVNHNHPVVIEWSKACDSISKFKESLITILEEYQLKIPQLASFVEELKTIELPTLDQKQDINGQITEMRFSLALLLHQIEQTLQESFAEVMASQDKQVPMAVTSNDTEAPLNPSTDPQLEMVVAHLTKHLQQTETNHKAETEKNKDVIAQLSSKVENLKIEVAQLRKALPSQPDNREGMIMFTRLDSERNSKALEIALETKRISSATLSQLTSSMEDYLTLPGQRLATLSQRYREKTEAAKLVQQVQISCSSDSHRAGSTLKRISSREERRQRRFSVTMSRLGEERSQLAHTLTDSLRHVEGLTRLFLIKPVYSGTYQSHDLITPISRLPPPVSRYNSASGSKSRNRPGTSHSLRASTANSNIRRVQSFLQAQRQQVDPQDLVECVNAANSVKHRGSSSTSPVSPSKRCHSSLSTSLLPSPAIGPGTGVWNARNSTVLTVEEAAMKDPTLVQLPSKELQPTFSKILELDIGHLRQPDTLLGHLLPNLHHQPYTHHMTRSRHHTPSPRPQKLLALPEESGSSSNSSQVRQEGYRDPWKRALPSVEVPSRTDTLTVM